MSASSRYLACALGATLACLCLVHPPLARAEIPRITGFTASPATVKPGGSTVLSAAIEPLDSTYHVAIVNTDTGETVTRCTASVTPCYREIQIPWSQNASPKDLHFEAEVIPSWASPTGSGTGLTVHVERFEWSISLEASNNPLTVGEKTKLTVKGLEPSPAYTGYHTKIVNDTTGEQITTCWGYECWHEIEFPYSMEAEAGPVEVHAEVVTETAPYDVAGRADLTLWVDPILFGVSMSFSEPETIGSETSWLATLSASPQLLGTPFSIAVENPSGEFVASCALWVTCGHRLGPGTYRAVVKDSENVYAATQWWTINPSSGGGGGGSEPEEDSADDFNLLALAALFAGPSEVCTALLFYPGTHFEGGSVSDQYLACEEAVGEGKSTVNVLKAVAAAGGGTAVLWYLYEEKTKEQTPAEDTEPEEETEPPPVPPIGWPGEITAEAELLQELNPQLKSAREARDVIKQCQRLVIRASLPTSRCTELPIFASGDLDVPQATQHDIEALLHYPPWVKLNYENAETKTGRGWYNALSVCDEEPPRIRNCDEFPFFSTEQGGGSAQPRPSLKLINATQNKRQGGKLARFYDACGVNIGKGRPFLSIPMPPGSNVTTLSLCNGNS